MPAANPFAELDAQSEKQQPQNPFAALDAQQETAPLNPFAVIDRQQEEPKKRTARAQELADDDKFDAVQYIRQNKTSEDERVAKEAAWLQYQKPVTLEGAVNTAGRFAGAILTETGPAVASMARGAYNVIDNATDSTADMLRKAVGLSGRPGAERSNRELEAGAELGMANAANLGEKAWDQTKQYLLPGRDYTRADLDAHIDRQLAILAASEDIGKGELHGQADIVIPESERPAHERRIQDLGEILDPTNVPFLTGAVIPAKAVQKAASLGLRGVGTAAEWTGKGVAEGVEKVAKSKFARGAAKTSPVTIAADMIATGGTTTAAAATAAASGAAGWAGAKLMQGTGKLMREAGEELGGAYAPTGQSWYRKAAKQGIGATATGTISAFPLAIGAETPEELAAIFGPGAVLAGTTGLLYGATSAKTIEKQAEFGAFVRDGQNVTFPDAATEQADADLMNALPPEAQEIIHFWRGYFNGATTPDGNPITVLPLDREAFIAAAGQDSNGAYLPATGQLLVNVGERGTDGKVAADPATIAYIFAHEGKHAINKAFEHAQPDAHRELTDKLKKRFSVDGKGTEATPEFLDWIQGQLQLHLDNLTAAGATPEQINAALSSKDMAYWLEEASADIGQSLITGQGGQEFVLSQGMLAKAWDGIKDWAAEKKGVNIPAPGDVNKGHLDLPTAQAATREVRRQLYQQGEEARARRLAREQERANARGPVPAAQPNQLASDRAQQLRDYMKRPRPAGQTAEEAKAFTAATRDAASELKELGEEPDSAPSATAAAATGQQPPAATINRYRVAAILKKNGLSAEEAKQWADAADGATDEEAVLDALKKRAEKKFPSEKPNTAAKITPGQRYNDENGISYEITGESAEAPRIGDIVVGADGRPYRVTKLWDNGSADVAFTNTPIGSRPSSTLKAGTFKRVEIQPAETATDAQTSNSTSTGATQGDAQQPATGEQTPQTGADKATATVEPQTADQPALTIATGPGGRFIIIDAAGNPANRTTYATEADAQRGIDMRGKRASFGLPPSPDGNDIIDAILEQGGINLESLSREERNNVFPHAGIWRSTIASNPNRDMSADEMARVLAPSPEDQAAGIQGFGDGDPRTMFDLITAAITARRRYAEQSKQRDAEQRRETTQEAARRRIAEREAKKNPPQDPDWSTDETTTLENGALPEGGSDVRERDAENPPQAEPVEISTADMDGIAARARETFLSDKPLAKAGQNKGQHTKENQKAADKAAFDAAAAAHAATVPEDFPGIRQRTDQFGQKTVSGTIDPARAFDAWLIRQAQESGNLPGGALETMLALQDAIGTTISYDYGHAKVGPQEKGEMQTAAERAASQAENSVKKRLSGEAEQDTARKTSLPLRVAFNSGTKSFTVYGVSQEKLLNNFNHLTEKMAELGIPIPFRDINDPRFVAAFKAVIRNHEHGWTGDGRRPSIGTEEFPNRPDPEWQNSPERTVVAADQFEFVNAILADEGAKQPKRGDATVAKAKAHLANENRRLLDESGETNPLRQKINAASEPIDGKPWTKSQLEDPLNENISPALTSNIGEASQSDESIRVHGKLGDLGRFFDKGKTPDRAKTAAGFMPKDAGRWEAPAEPKARGKRAVWNAHNEIKSLLYKSGLLEQSVLDELDSDKEPPSYRKPDIEQLMRLAGDKRDYDEIISDNREALKADAKHRVEFREGEDADIFEWARQNHGVADSIETAGYILPDGDLLDFSESRHGGGGSRSADHRQIGYPGRKSEGYEAMRTFMEAGGVRIDANSGVIDIATAPTSAQYRVIQQVIQSAGRGYIDLTDGDRKTTIEVDGEDAQRAVGRIRRFYSGEDMEGGQLFMPADTAGAEERPAATRKRAAKLWAEKGVDSPFFRKWFGGSKVVDDQGKPLIVRHVTDKPFTTVDMKKGAQGVFWFTSDTGAIERGETGAQGRGTVMELYVAMENPAGWAEYEKKSLGELKRDGFDGVILPNDDGTFDGIAFEPNQVKSATSNTGEFDPGKKSINFMPKEGDPNASRGENLAREAEEAGIPLSIAALKGLIQENPATMERIRDRIREKTKREPRFMPATLKEDMTEQAAWFTERAKDKGHDSMEALLDADPDEFFALAARWRDEHQRETASGGIAYMPKIADDRYLAAAESGDTATAQRLVDAAAKAAGYSVGPLFHGTKADFTAFDNSKHKGFSDVFYHFGNENAANARHGGHGKKLRVFLDAKNPLRLEDPGYWSGEYMSESLAKAGIDINPSDTDEATVSKAIRDEGYDSIIYINDTEGGDSYAVFNPSQIKSADPITRDDAGRIIPLSERFNPATSDLRFMPKSENGEPVTPAERREAIGQPGGEPTGAEKTKAAARARQAARVQP